MRVSDGFSRSERGREKRPATSGHLKRFFARSWRAHVRVRDAKWFSERTLRSPISVHKCRSAAREWETAGKLREQRLVAVAGPAHDEESLTRRANDLCRTTTYVVGVGVSADTRFTSSSSWSLLLYLLYHRRYRLRYALRVTSRPRYNIIVRCATIYSRRQIFLSYINLYTHTHVNTFVTYSILQYNDTRKSTRWYVHIIQHCTRKELSLSLSLIHTNTHTHACTHSNEFTR